MPTKPSLAELVATVEKAEASLRAARAEASAVITAHIGAHQAEVDAAKALLTKAVGKIEDEAEDAVKFVLTNQISARQIIRWGLIGGATLVSLWAVFHGAF